MRIGVMSPCRGTGSTTVAMMIATMLSEAEGKNTLLLTDSQTNKIINRAFDINEESADPTRSPEHIIALLKTEAIKPEQIADYCTRRVRSLDILSLSGKKNLDPIEVGRMAYYVTENAIHDHVVVDMLGGVFDGTTEKILDLCNVVIMVIDQNMTTLEWYNIWKSKKQIWDILSKKSVIYVLNRYNPVVSSVRDVAKAYKVKPGIIKKLTYNPWIIRNSNKGKLHIMSRFLLDNDYRVMDITSDMKELMELVSNHDGLHSRWRFLK